jgi:HEAT repeat protein
MVRSAAAEALGKIGDASALRPLRSALLDHDAEVRDAARDALGQIGVRLGRAQVGV